RGFAFSALPHRCTQQCCLRHTEVRIVAKGTGVHRCPFPRIPRVPRLTRGCPRRENGDSTMTATNHPTDANATSPADPTTLESVADAAVERALRWWRDSGEGEGGGVGKQGEQDGQRL